MKRLVAVVLLGLLVALAVSPALAAKGNNAKAGKRGSGTAPARQAHPVRHPRVLDQLNSLITDNLDPFLVCDAVIDLGGACPVGWVIFTQKFTASGTNDGLGDPNLLGGINALVDENGAQAAAAALELDTAGDYFAASCFFSNMFKGNPFVDELVPSPTNLINNPTFNGNFRYARGPVDLNQDGSIGPGEGNVRWGRPADAAAVGLTQDIYVYQPASATGVTMRWGYNWRVAQGIDPACPNGLAAVRTMTIADQNSWISFSDRIINQSRQRQTIRVNLLTETAYLDPEYRVWRTGSLGWLAPDPTFNVEDLSNQIGRTWAVQFHSIAGDPVYNFQPFVGGNFAIFGKQKPAVLFLDNVNQFNPGAARVIAGYDLDLRPNQSKTLEHVVVIGRSDEEVDALLRKTSAGRLPGP